MDYVSYFLWCTCVSPLIWLLCMGIDKFLIDYIVVTTGVSVAGEELQAIYDPKSKFRKFAELAGGVLCPLIGIALLARRIFTVYYIHNRPHYNINKRTTYVIVDETENPGYIEVPMQ